MHTWCTEDTMFNQSFIEDSFYLSCEVMEANLVLDHIGVVVVCKDPTKLGPVADLGKCKLAILQAALCGVLVDGKTYHM